MLELRVNVSGRSRSYMKRPASNSELDVERWALDVC